MPVVSEAPLLGAIGTGVTSASILAGEDSFSAEAGTAFRGVFACVSHVSYSDRRMLPSVDAISLSSSRWKGYEYGSEEESLRTLTDLMTTRSTEDVLGSAWLWCVMRRALQSVTLKPDSLAVPTTAGAPFDSPNRSTQTFVQMPQAKAVVPEEKRRSVEKNDCCEDIVREREFGEEKKKETINVRIGNALVERGL